MRQQRSKQKAGSGWHPGQILVKVWQRAEFAEDDGGGATSAIMPMPLATMPKMTDRAEQIRLGDTLGPWHRRASAAARPAAGDLALLAHAGFVGELNIFPAIIVHAPPL